MSRRVVLPTDLQITEALEALGREQPAKPPTVVAIAQHFGLSNATFWRHFPDLCQEIVNSRRDALRSHPAGNQNPNDVDHQTLLARLRNNNARLEGDLKLAAAEIQRLTLENRALVIHAELTTDVIPLRPRN